MSTRSSIAVQHADGSVSAVYCHFDGYLEGVGAELVSKHDSQDAAEALVSLGDLSSVCKEVRAYHRDRGEPFADVAPKRYRDMAQYLALVSEHIGDNGYRYIYSDGAWLVWGDVSPSPIPVRNASERDA
jgi:hypothetical protein